AQYEQRRAKVEAKPITIEVQPLPPKPIKWGGPVPVGTITLDYAVDRRTIELGETVEFDIVISGDGDLRSLTLPLDTLPKEFKVYQSQPELTSTINNERVSFK